MKTKKLISAAVLVILTAACSVSLSEDEVSNPFIGVTHIHRTLTSPRLLDIHIVIIDPDAEGISFRVTPPAADLKSETKLQTVKDFMVEEDAQIAINGGFFYWADDHYDVMGFAASDGTVYSPFVGWYGFPEMRSFNISSDNVASVIFPCGGNPGYSACPFGVPVYNALPGSEQIVDDGENTTSSSYSLNNALHPRSAAGVTYDGEIVLFTVDGRNDGHSRGMYTSEVADMLIDLGVKDAINLDGGGSTTLTFADPYPRLVNVPVGTGEPYTERQTANNLAVFAIPLSNKPDIIILNDFENGDEGTFAYSPGYSGSTQGIISADSTAEASDSEARTGSWSQKLFIKDDPEVDSVSENPDGGWFVRHVSGPSASPSQNITRPVQGYIGLWVKTSSSETKISIAIDNESEMERGIPKSLTGDSQWHVYQWNLDDSSGWEGWYNGDGTVTQTEFTIDSIQILGSNEDVTLYIDDIIHNPTGKLDEPQNCKQLWTLGFGEPADFDQNCLVDMRDMKELADHWLTSKSSRDIYPPEGDGIINLGDITRMADVWLTSSDPNTASP